MKKLGLRYARLSAAAAAVLCGGYAAHAQSVTVTWDPTATMPPGDGSGNWDTTATDTEWLSGSSLVAWSNSDPNSTPTGLPDSAVFGTGTSTSPTPLNVVLSTPIAVENLTINNASATAYYNFGDEGDSGEQLTLNGNFLKASTIGGTVFSLSSSINLPAGNHVITLQDSPGDTPPEVTMNNGFTGAGSLTLDNGFNSSGYPQWGTMVLNTDSDYSGGTTITKGRLVVNTTNGLGSGTVTIGSQGNLSFGGAGTNTLSSLTISNPVVITRNTYTGTDFSDYPDAITSTNPGNAGKTLTFAGPFVVDSTNAQIAADTSTIIIPGNITQGPDVTNGMLTLDGDFAGYVTLGGNNSALTGGIQVIGGVELNASSLANLGGPTGTLIMNGSGTFHPVGGSITSFGTLNVNYSTFAGGIDVDPGESFTISQNLGGSGNTNGSIGERGAGTLNLSGTDSLGGTTFWDGWSAQNGVGGGVINLTGTVTLGSLHLRSPVVNVTGLLTLSGNSGYSSFGQDSTGTNGSPDQATVNISGNGQLIIPNSNGNDFNLSDNANTSATINLSGNGTLSLGGGVTFLGKSAGATGTINQTGGSLIVTRNGNFGFVIADGRGSGTPTGNYNLSAGTFTDENGEIYVGEGSNGTGHGVGYWTQTGGTATFGNWFVVGREGGQGTVLISGGTLTKDTSNGGANVSIGEGGANVCTLTVDGNGAFNVESGQFFDGNNSSVGIVNVGSSTDPVNATPSLTVNNWLAVGRNGTSVGTLNLYDGSVTDNDNPTGGNNQNWFDIGGDGGSANGTVNVYGGTLTTNGIWIGENGNCTGVLNVSGGSASVGILELALNDSATGTINISNGSLTAGATTIGQGGSGSGVLNISGGSVSLGATIFANTGSVNGTINLNGGTLSATGFTAQNGGGTGIGKFFFNGGTLTTTSGNVNNNFIGAKVTSVVSTGGAIVNANGGYININSALTHDTTLSGADGGLTVTGTGTVQLGTPGSHAPINIYTGPTKVQSGTLIVSTTGSLPTNTAVAINNGTLQLGVSTGLATVSALAITGNGTFDVSNNHVIINYGAGPDPISSIAALLHAGYAAGAWNGAGGIVTSAPLVNGGLTYGLGYADAADPQDMATGLASGTIEIKYTLLGDADLNGIVNGLDFGILAANFNKGITGWDEGDFDYNNIVNGLDFGDLAANFNKGAAGTAVGGGALSDPALVAFAQANGLMADVPEPVSLGLLTVGAVGMLARRRRRTARL